MFGITCAMVTGAQGQGKRTCGDVGLSWLAGLARSCVYVVVVALLFEGAAALLEPREVKRSLLDTSRT